MPWLYRVNGCLIFRAAMNPIVPYTGESRVVPLELPEHLMYFLGSLTVFVFVGVFWAVEGLCELSWWSFVVVSSADLL